MNGRRCPVFSKTMSGNNLLALPNPIPSAPLCTASSSVHSSFTQNRSFIIISGLHQTLESNVDRIKLKINICSRNGEWRWQKTNFDAINQFRTLTLCFDAILFWISPESNVAPMNEITRLKYRKQLLLYLRRKIFFIRLWLVRILISLAKPVHTCMKIHHMTPFLLKSRTAFVIWLSTMRLVQPKMDSNCLFADPLLMLSINLNWPVYLRNGW